MAWWTVSTKQKKNVYEHELWQKDDMVIRRVSGFRWGTVLIETDDNNPPVLDQTDGPGVDAVDMYNTEYNYELESLDDGWYGDIIWPDDMDDEERERLEILWDDDSYSGWEEDGWVQYDTECWFHGPLEIVADSNQKEWIKADNLLELQEIFEKDMTDNAHKSNSVPEWPFPTGTKSND